MTSGRFYERDAPHVGIEHFEAFAQRPVDAQKTATFPFPGAALLEFSDGTGVVRINGKVQSVRGGTVLTVI